MESSATMKVSKTGLADRLFLYEYAISRIASDYSIITAREFAREFQVQNGRIEAKQTAK